jgi:sialate O-acetylesterase
MYRELRREGARLRVSFDHAGAGLVAATKEGHAPPRIEPEGRLRRFAIAGADRRWRWAEATIDGDTVVVSHPDVPEPVAVRYAFAINPEGANLYNRDGLPASPFRSDDW